MNVFIRKVVIKMPRQDVTKLLSSTIKEFATFKDDDVRDGVLNVLEALDTDLEAIEYGQSDEVNDKMALLFAANGDARESAEEVEQVVSKKVKEEDEDEEDDEIEAGGWHERTWTRSAWLDGWRAARIWCDGPHAARRGGCGRRAAGNLHQGCGADPPAEVRAVPSSRRDGADVFADLSRDAAVGALD